jgi:hypothetical protein
VTITEKVKNWANRIGSQEAHIKLIQAGISASLATKLIHGLYDHEPGRLVKDAIKKAMAA